MIKNAVVYLISGVISKSAPFFTLIYLTKYLSNAEFNYASLLISAVTIVNVFISFGTQATIPKFYFKKQKDDEFKNYIFSIILVVTSVFILINVLVIFASISLDVSLDYYIVGLVSFTLAIYNIYLSLLRVKEAVKRYFFLELSYALIFVVSVLLSIHYFDNLTYQAWFYSYAIVSAIFFMIAATAIYKECKGTDCRNVLTIKEVFNLSAPLVPHSLALITISISDRFILERFVSTHELSGYILAANVGLAVKVFSDALMKSWNVFYAKNHSKEYIYKYKLAIVLLVLIFSFVVYAFFSLIFDYYFDDSYRDSLTYLPVLLLSLVLFNLYQINVSRLILESRTKVLPLITPFSAFVNVSINLLYIPTWGAQIAAWSTCLAYLLMSSLVYLYLRKNNA
ncbi:lipopolysaccharide biosynthesis protein [Aliivibrio sifiae]|uniref:Uncharacterized protein n=1 Tax=Aliivibrio sifiae TaxID=566293 RepID=A0A2S7X0R4_9GAMM|nr:oligosaccharide flippase family protein [Aliivibrio sifiae]PQJ83348.1 hypothetical protein BTO22_18345 [Aliivibrio sifiae]